MEHGAWSMEHGAWSMEHGAWCMEHGAWCMEHGVWSQSLRDSIDSPRLTTGFDCVHPLGYNCRLAIPDRLGQAAELHTQNPHSPGTRNYITRLTTGFTTYFTMNITAG